MFLCAAALLPIDFPTNQIFSQLVPTSRRLSLFVIKCCAASFKFSVAGVLLNFFLCVASLRARLCNATLHSPSAATKPTCCNVGATPSNHFCVLFFPIQHPRPHRRHARNAGRQLRLRFRSDHFLIQGVDSDAPGFSVALRD